MTISERQSTVFCLSEPTGRERCGNKDETMWTWSVDREEKFPRSVREAMDNLATLDEIPSLCLMIRLAT